MTNKLAELPILLTTERPLNGVAPSEFGSTLFVVHIFASNVVRDLKENIRNMVGGRMHHYEDLITTTTEMALQKMQLKLQYGGWHGAVSVRISHPNVVDGGCEILVYGTPFRFPLDRGAAPQFTYRT
jgi:uncharacterized protein YbjQ (UPF0145 family)